MPCPTLFHELAASWPRGHHRTVLPNRDEDETRLNDAHESRRRLSRDPCAPESYAYESAGERRPFLRVRDFETTDRKTAEPEVWGRQSVPEVCVPGGWQIRTLIVVMTDVPSRRGFDPRTSGWETSHSQRDNELIRSAAVSLPSRR